MSTGYNNSIENLLNNDGLVTYKVFGKSMEPMILSNKDLVTIRRRNTDEQLHENDVVLYRQREKLTLHRIVKVLPNGEFILLGDNCSKKEYGIQNKDIIGILVSFKHKGIHYDVTDKSYIDYLHKLRNHDKQRMVRKLIYDIIIQHLGFLPASLFEKLKACLKKLIIYKIELE